MNGKKKKKKKKNWREKSLLTRKSARDKSLQSEPRHKVKVVQIEREREREREYYARLMK